MSCVALDVLGRYQGAVSATRRSWRPPIASRSSATSAATSPGSPGSTSLQTRPPPSPSCAEPAEDAPELADKAYDVLLDPQRGFARKAEMDIEGLKTVLALRSEYGEPKRTLTDPLRYVDLSYYDEASNNQNRAHRENCRCFVPLAVPPPRRSSGSPPFCRSPPRRKRRSRSRSVSAWR